MEYVPEEIALHRIHKGKKEYLIYWKNKKVKQMSWEAEEDLNCQELIDRYNRVYPNEFKPISVVNHRINPEGEIEYLIRWRGLGQGGDSWVPKGTYNIRKVVAVYNKKLSGTGQEQQKRQQREKGPESSSGSVRDSGDKESSETGTSISSDSDEDSEEEGPSGISPFRGQEAQEQVTPGGRSRDLEEAGPLGISTVSGLETPGPVRSSDNDCQSEDDLILRDLEVMRQLEAQGLLNLGGEKNMKKDSNYTSFICGRQHYHGLSNEPEPPPELAEWREEAGRPMDPDMAGPKEMSILQELANQGLLKLSKKYRKKEGCKTPVSRKVKPSGTVTKNKKKLNTKTKKV